MIGLAEDQKLEFAAAVARYRSGAPAQAAELFADLLQRAPDHVDTLRLYGLALVRSGRALAGLPNLARARRLAFHDPLTHLHYGVGLLEAGRVGRAAAVLRRATFLGPKDPVAWINLSTAILSLGKPQAARAAARRAIALAPNAAEARYALGLAHRAAKDVRGAASAFKEAVRLRPDRADAWIELGIARLQLGQIGAASTAMRQALVVRPGYPPAEANLAGLELLQGAQDEALDRLRRLIVSDPTCVAARLNLANALLLDREAKEALDALEGPPPSGREGAHWRAHRAMALLLLGRYREAEAELAAAPEPLGDAEILIAWRRLVLAEHAGNHDAATALAERLEALANEEGASLLDHRIITHFDLAVFRNRRKEPERSFAHWTAGHRLLSRVQPFSREHFRNFVDASIEGFDEQRLNAGARSRNADPLPVFIVGLPRSGTSLTEQILAAHPEVHGAGERSALHRTVVNIAGPFLHAATIPRLAALEEPALTAAAERYVEDLRALAPTARYVVDKMPVNALQLGFLSTLLPGARIILCGRDHRDIGLSIFQLRFFGYHPFAHDLADLGWYMGEHERLIGHWRKTLPTRWLQIELSDWVENFSATLGKLLDFLDLPYDSACERFYEQRRRVRTASAQQVRKPINARGLGRWRRFENELAPMLSELRGAGVIDAPGWDAAQEPSAIR